MSEHKPVHTEVPAHPHHHHTSTNGLATAAMVVGIVAFISGWLPFWGLLSGITAVVLGIIALKKPVGKGMAIAGIITGGLAALTSILFTVIFIVTLTAAPAIISEANNQIKEEAAQSQQMIDAKKDFTKGETAVFGTLEVKVNSVVSNYVPESTYYHAEEGKEYIIVNITVKNTGGDNEYIGPYTFSMNNNGIATANAFVSVDPELSANDLAPGDSTTGNVVYEVNEGATNLKLQYETTVFTENYESVKLVYTLAV